MIKLSREFKTGLIAILTIVLFIWGFSFIKNDNLFKKERVFYAVYKNVQGLESSSLVTINGFKVGKIDNISFYPKKNGYLIVKFSLNTDFNFSKNSIAKIYSSDLIGTKSLSVIPNYKGKTAVSGDTLKSEIEQGVFELLNEKVAPLQAKFESMITNTDSIMQSLNNILDVKTKNNIKISINSLKNTLLTIEKTAKSLDSIVIDNKSSLEAVLNNSKDITHNLKLLTDSLNNVNIAATINKFHATINSLDEMLTDIKSGKGSVPIIYQFYQRIKRIGRVVT